MPKKNKELSFDDIQQKVEIEIKAAEKNNENRAGKREKSWNRYRGEKLGNEVKGRSQFITRDLLETIEWMMPYFIRTFAAGDPKIDIEIKGQEPWVSKAVMDKIQTDLGNGTPNIFLIFYQWFKDALVSDTAFTKAMYIFDREKVTVRYDELPIEFMQQLTQDQDVEITGAGAVDITRESGVVFKDVEIAVNKIIKDEIYAENTPHWEFLADPKSRDVNDEYGKGHKTEVTVDYLKRINRARTEDKKKPYFKNMDRLESGEGKSETESGESEKSNYMGDDQPQADLETEVGPKSPVTFIEWYTRLDVDGDGYLEDVVCFVGNGHLLRWEENEDGFIPFSAIKPIIDCYKFFGISYSDLLVEIQNLKTMLFRRILDNFDFQNSGRWLRDPGSGIDTYALLNNMPGSVITGKIDGLKDLTPAPFNPSSLGLLEYVDTVKENRTGLTKYNQGMDSGSLNKTARGITQIQNAAMQRMELVGRIFAETGLKDFYRKLAILLQKNLKRPFTAKVQGEEKEVTPEMLQGTVTAKVNMGVTASVGLEEAQKIEHIMGVLFSIDDRKPGLLDAEKIHNIAKRLITSSGFRQADDFITDAKTYIINSQQQQQQAQQMQQQMMQMQQQMGQMELQIKGKDAETKAAAVQAKVQDSKFDYEIDKLKLSQDVEIEMMKLETDKKIERMKVLQKEKDSQRDYKVGLLKSIDSRREADRSWQSQGTQ